MVYDWNPWGNPSESIYFSTDLYWRKRRASSKVIDLIHPLLHLTPWLVPKANPHTWYQHLQKSFPICFSTSWKALASPLSLPSPFPFDFSISGLFQSWLALLLLELSSRPESERLVLQPLMSSWVFYSWNVLGIGLIRLCFCSWLGLYLGAFYRLMKLVDLDV